MLRPSALSAQAFRYDNWGADPSATPGTSVTPGISNAEGAWTQIASSANIAAHVYFVTLQVNGGALTGVIKSQLLDIGIDPAGGTAYTALIENIMCGGSCVMGTPAPGNICFSFPIYIPSGSSVAVRIQGSHTVAGTVNVAMTFRGAPAAPQALPVGTFSAVVGTLTGSQGVAFTPGTIADGTWVSLGTTTAAMWWWQLCWQVSNAVVTVEYCYIELAHGDATNKHTLVKLMKTNLSTESFGVALQGNLDYGSCYWPLPAGAELWVRGRADSAPDTGYNAVAIGIGG